MRARFTEHAADDVRFGQDAFDAQVGKRVPLNMVGSDGITIGECEIVAATVAGDGRSVEFEIEFDMGSFGPDR